MSWEGIQKKLAAMLGDAITTATDRAQATG